MIDFPASPTVGQNFAAPNGVTYQWSGTVWVSISAGSGGASITVSDTPPASPTAGALWWNSVLGTMFIYFQDANSSQWVPAAPSAQTQQQILWRQLARIVPSAGQQFVDFTNLPSDINDLELRFDVSPTVNSPDLYIQFYDNTGTLDATTNHYTFSQVQSGHTNNAATVTGYGSGGYGATNAIYLNLIVASAHVGISTGIRGSAKIYNIRDSAHIKGMSWQCEYLGDGGAVWYAITGSGNRGGVSGAITGLRLAFNTTTLAAGGAVSLWGSP